MPGMRQRPVIAEQIVRLAARRGLSGCETVRLDKAIKSLHGRTMHSYMHVVYLAESAADVVAWTEQVLMQNTSIEVVEVGTKKVVKTLGPVTARKARKVSRDLRLNLKASKYLVRCVKATAVGE